MDEIPSVTPQVPLQPQERTNVASINLFNIITPVGFFLIITLGGVMLLDLNPLFANIVFFVSLALCHAYLKWYKKTFNISLPNNSGSTARRLFRMLWGGAFISILTFYLFSIAATIARVSQLIEDFIAHVPTDGMRLAITIVLVLGVLFFGKLIVKAWIDYTWPLNHKEA